MCTIVREGDKHHVLLRNIKIGDLKISEKKYMDRTISQIGKKEDNVHFLNFKLNNKLPSKLNSI